MGVPMASSSTTTKPSSAIAWRSRCAVRKLRLPTLPLCGPG